jgi:hypothetical protein
LLPFARPSCSRGAGAGQLQFSAARPLCLTGDALGSGYRAGREDPTFASLLVELIAALRRSRNGALLAITGDGSAIGTTSSMVPVDGQFADRIHQRAGLAGWFGAEPRLPSRITAVQ